jgi:hypothetical protein
VDISRSLVVVALAGAACSATQAVDVSDALPSPYLTYSGTFAGLPDSCSGDTYFIESDVGSVCNGSDVYVLCNSGSFGSAYECSPPPGYEEYGVDAGVAGIAGDAADADD